MQGVKYVRRHSLVSVQLVGNVRLAMHGATGGQRDNLPLQRELDRLLHLQPHPADLLDEELAAAGGALVVRKDIGDPAAGEKIDQEGFSSQRGHGVEIPA
jgi:hypothetical protein